MQRVCICAGASPGSSQVWHLLTEAAESLIYWLTSNTRPPRFRLWAQMSYRIRMRIKARVHLALLLWREGGFLWGFPWSQPLPPSAAAPTPIPYPCVCVLTALPDLFHYWTLSLTYFLITSAGVTPNCWEMTQKGEISARLCAIWWIFPFWVGVTEKFGAKYWAERCTFSPLLTRLQPWRGNNPNLERLWLFCNLFLPTWDNYNFSTFN